MRKVIIFLTKGRKWELTQKEFDLLRLFLKNSGRVFTRQNLLDCGLG